MTNFLLNQPLEFREKYSNYLSGVGSLSRLFSDNSAPYIYYRAHENAFCEAFGAENLARGDISFDAKKGKLAIGLKTFLRGSGITFQKVAEFNSESKNFREKFGKELAEFVAKLRNDRLDLAKNITGCTEMIYHLAVREDGKINLVEFPMDYIEISQIDILEDKPTTLKFTDGKNEYSFSKSKSTLLEKFDVRENLESFDVKILENPFEIFANKTNEIFREKFIEKNDVSENVILPLYSTKSGKVEEKSGLNQWNAAGRKRNPNEIYIPIPSEIREKVYRLFGDFAKTDENHSMKNSRSFDLLLPNGEKLRCKIAQQGGKALMSEHNADLGQWLLRDVLQLKEGELLTREKLDFLGIDSVKITKLGGNKFTIDFVNNFQE